MYHRTTNPQRGRKRVGNNGLTTSTAYMMNRASTTAQPTADEIAAAMITQLRVASLHLTDSSGVRISYDRLSSVCVGYALVQHRKWSPALIIQKRVSTHCRSHPQTPPTAHWYPV